VVTQTRKTNPETVWETTAKNQEFVH